MISGVAYFVCVTQFVEREEGGGNQRTFKEFNNKNKQTQSKAAAPHGRLPHTKHKLKSRPGHLSSCTVVAPPFILPELLRGLSYVYSFRAILEKMGLLGNVKI